MGTGRNVGMDYPFKTARDMSAVQYHGVYISADDTIDIPNSATTIMGGVLQNKPAATGRAGTVRISGQTKVKAGGTLAAGEMLHMTASGYFVKCTSGGRGAGLCIKGANSGYIGEAILDRGLNIAVSSAATGQG